MNTHQILVINDEETFTFKKLESDIFAWKTTKTMNQLSK